MIDQTRTPVALGAALRDAGLSRSIADTLAFHDALACFAPIRLVDLYWSGRTTLVHQVDDVEVYDRVFAEWAGFDTSPRPLGDHPSDRTVALDAGGDRSDPDATVLDDANLDQVVRFSAVEQLRRADLAGLDDAERSEAWRAIARLRIARPARRGGRWGPSGRSHDPVDLRSSVRRAVRDDGEIVELVRRRRRDRPRRVVLLVDVSGSMAAYSRAMLRFAHAVGRAGIPTETFALGTRVTRLSRALHERDPDRALALTAELVEDWSGGTRLGADLATFCDRWGQRGVARGAVVVVLSDGWDRGDPELLAGQMARLRRLAHRIIWVNPLRATEGYEPTAVGMAAALPYCDRFMDGHSVMAFEDLAGALLGAADRARRSAP